MFFIIKYINFVLKLINVSTSIFVCFNCKPFMPKISKSCSGLYYIFTDENSKAMIKQVDDFLSSDGFSRIPKIVRLSFHDCISGCNGCINATNPDNAGLTAIATESTSFHRNFVNLKYNGNSLSRADFWAILASRALYIASNNSPGLTQPVLEFKFGRKDCPAGSLFDQTEILPGAGGSWDKVSVPLINLDLLIEK
jgi:hypothetical protein